MGGCPGLGGEFQDEREVVWAVAKDVGIGASIPEFQFLLHYLLALQPYANCLISWGLSLLISNESL